MSERKKTTTSNFGVGRRESHDASDFYSRFSAPEISADAKVPKPRAIADPFVVGDSRNMSALKDNEVALVVTSPPYFAGKQYEQELERDGIPSSYSEYLELLEGVFAECKRVLEPGGRIAVNVANLGRKPYRSLASDVVEILQRLGLLLRGEVVWQKGEGAGGSCAWGSFKSPANPVLRDLTERVIIASKGRFDRSMTAKERAASGLPSEITISTDEFLAATLDVWHLAPESAKRVNHPAPFPVALPERLIQLYTYKNDLVIDPFLGSGSTLVAAHKLGRRYLGYDLDPDYVEIARNRVADEGVLDADVTNAAGKEPTKAIKATKTTKTTKTDGKEAQSRRSFIDEATKSGASAVDVAKSTLEFAGFKVAKTDVKIPKTGVELTFLAHDSKGGEWYFDLSGTFTTAKNGLVRADTTFKTLGRISTLSDSIKQRLVLLTTNLPTAGSQANLALRSVSPSAFFDAIALLDIEGLERLGLYATGKTKTPIV